MIYPQEARITTPSDDIPPGRNSSQLLQPQAHVAQQHNGHNLDGSGGDDEVDAVHRRLRSGAGGGGERRGSAEKLRKKADQVRKKSTDCNKHM